MFKWIMWDAIFFWGFAGLTVILGILVIAFRNPVHSAVALIGNLFCVAALFAMLDAHFMAAIQVLVYAGAILVLFLFVIMLLNLKPEELGRAKRTLPKFLGFLLLVWFGVLSLTQFISIKSQEFPQPPENFGTIEQIGHLLFGRQLLPFEVASVLLLSAIVGAVAIAKKKLR